MRGGGRRRKRKTNKEPEKSLLTGKTQATAVVPTTSPPQAAAVVPTTSPPQAAAAAIEQATAEAAAEAGVAPEQSAQPRTLKEFIEDFILKDSGKRIHSEVLKKGNLPRYLHNSPVVIYAIDLTKHEDETFMFDFRILCQEGSGYMINFNIDEKNNITKINFAYNIENIFEKSKRSYIDENFMKDFVKEILSVKFILPVEKQEE